MVPVKAGLKLSDQIINSDVKSLTSIPGIGAKTAKRIIIELKEKFSIIDDNDDGLGFSDESDTLIVNDAKNALKSLGYKT